MKYNLNKTFTNPRRWMDRLSKFAPMIPTLPFFVATSAVLARAEPFTNTSPAPSKAIVANVPGLTLASMKSELHCYLMGIEVNVAMSYTLIRES